MDLNGFVLITKQNMPIKIVSKKVLKEVSISDENEYVRAVAKKRMSL